MGRKFRPRETVWKSFFQSHSSGPVNGKLLKEKVWKKMREHREMVMGWEGGIGNVLTKTPRTTCQSFRFLILHSPPDSYFFPQVFRSVVVGTDPAKKRKGLQYQCRLVGEGMHSATPRSRVKAGEATACLPPVSNSPYCKFQTHGETLRECDLLSLVRLKRRL